MSLMTMNRKVFDGMADGPYLAKLTHVDMNLPLKMPVGQPAAISVGGLGVFFQQPYN